MNRKYESVPRANLRIKHEFFFFVDENFLVSVCGNNSKAWNFIKVLNDIRNRWVRRSSPDEDAQTSREAATSGHRGDDTRLRAGRDRTRDHLNASCKRGDEADTWETLLTDLKVRYKEV